MEIYIVVNLIFGFMCIVSFVDGYEGKSLNSNELRLSEFIVFEN